MIAGFDTVKRLRDGRFVDSEGPEPAMEQPAAETRRAG
jgi:hypothetical protein